MDQSLKEFVMSEKMELVNAGDGFKKLLDFEKLHKTWSDSARESSLEARGGKGGSSYNEGTNERFSSGPTKEGKYEVKD